MRGRQRTLFLRREFNVPQADKITELGLVVDFADAFIVYVNGREAARVGVGRSAGRNAQGVKPREEHGAAYVPLDIRRAPPVDGVNLIAIECHAAEIDQLDFRIAPSLVLED
jgi:hypothetical protein